MPNTPNSPFIAPPKSAPVARLKGMNNPPIVKPTPGPFSRMKAALPVFPSVHDLFHSPRKDHKGGSL